MKYVFPVGVWCLGDDFNITEYVRENKGISRYSNLSEIVEFGDFIFDMKLIDLLATNIKFSWFNS